MRKRILSLALVFVMIALAMAGCASNNDTQGSNTPEPTPTPAATPTPTPTPEPTPEPHVHDLTAANYQEAPVCKECGETVGEPLTPIFPTLGYKLSAFDMPQPYKTSTIDDLTLHTIGELTVSDFRIIESDDTHEAKEGFEWRVIHVKQEFSGDDIWVNGLLYTEITVDYYSFDLNESIVFDGSHKPTINYYGEDYKVEDDYKDIRSDWIEKGKQFIREVEISYCVPIGYDGLIIAFVNSANYKGNETEDSSVPGLVSDLIDADSVFFRLA